MNGSREIVVGSTVLTLNEFELTAEGIMGEGDDWSITMSFPGALLPVTPRSWKRRSELLFDEEDVEKMLWEEAMHALQKNAVFAHEQRTELVADEDLT